MEANKASKKSYFLETLRKFEEASAQNQTELTSIKFKNRVSSLDSILPSNDKKTPLTKQDTFSESVPKQKKPELPPKTIKLTKTNEIFKKDQPQRKISSSSSSHKPLDNSWESNSSISSSLENNGNIDGAETNDKEEEGTPTSKSHKVALELLQTEREYVSRLKLIVEVYYKEIETTNNEEKYLPQGFHEKIFSNVKSIYMLHQDVFLPDIEKCLENWGEGSSLGQVMIGMAPFLKFYTQYLMNLQQAFDVISSSCSKSERFAEVLKNLERSQDQDSTKGLGLRHLIQEPLSRIPRYQLLLTEFIKRLPEDSAERPSAEEALAVVAKTAEHLNAEIRKMEDFKRLLEVTSCLVGSGCESLGSVNRKFVFQGAITKTSARDGSMIKRHLFLFSDILLVCKEQPRLALNPQYLIKSCLDLYGMKVYDKEDCTFFVMSKQKSVEFVAQSLEEKNEWIRLLWTGISQVTKAKIKIESDKAVVFNNEEKFGERAPVWVRDQEVSMCMLCCVGFNAFKRRHHCRACGKVVCGNCSSQAAKLHYDKDKLQRVCDNCIKLLNPGIFISNQKTKLPSALRMQGDSEDGVLKEFMQVSNDNKSFTSRWLVLTSDGALYFFKAPKDTSAIDSLTLPGHQVDLEDVVVKVWHPHLKKYTYITNQDSTILQQWHTLMLHAAEGNLPLSKPSFRSSFYSEESYNNSPPVNREVSTASSNVFLELPPSDHTTSEPTSDNIPVTPLSNALSSISSMFVSKMLSPNNSTSKFFS